MLEIVPPRPGTFRHLIGQYYRETGPYMPLAAMVIGAEKDGVVSRVAGGAESQALARHRSFFFFASRKEAAGVRSIG